MATLVFSSIGTALAGPLGGAIGALAGRQFDSALFGRSARGPRLRELDVTLSSYGQPLPRIFGRMRVAGAVIWATELQEHEDGPGGTYTYSANLAVALSSRPIMAVGRIWADGKLLRDASGALQVGGIVRVHPGGDDQAVDPLVATAEGEGRCPAFRDLAYVVFEALDVSEYGNRIPTLTFEVIADNGVRLADVFDDPECEVLADIDALAGLSVEDTPGAALAMLDPVLPIAIDAAADRVRVRTGSPAADPILLDLPALADADDGFGKASGFTRRRSPALQGPAPVLRYFDIERDYLATACHPAARSGRGQPETVEVPVALGSAQARALVEALAIRRDEGRDAVAWRTCTLDARIAPGVSVRLPDRAGLWRVASWEWREAGVELELVREPRGLALPPQPARARVAASATPAASTRLVAFELPWDGLSGLADRRRVVAAVGATAGNWSGAALHLDCGDGQLAPVGQARRRRAAVGITQDTLAPASPLLIDRRSRLTVQLASDDQALDAAGAIDWARGANLALVGEELIRFARAEALGGGTWRLSHLLRGCAGTEVAIGLHSPGEAFALVDAGLTDMDVAPSAVLTHASVVALGLVDRNPVSAKVHLAGIAARPLAPVHPRAWRDPDGSLHLAWTRRSRGGWEWSDGVDVPLAEEAERYLVTFEAMGRPIRVWTVGQPSLALNATEVTTLRGTTEGGCFHVRQQGTRALSLPLQVATLP